MTMTMALLIVDNDDVEENDHHAGSTNAPQVPPIRPSTQVLLLPPIKPNGPSLSLLPNEAYSPPTQLKCISPHGTTIFITQQHNTIQSDNTIQYKVTAVDATQQGPGRAQT